MLYLGLSIAHDLFAAPSPSGIAQALCRDRHIVRLTRQIKRQYFKAPLEIIKPWKETLFPLQLIDRPVDRLLYLPWLWRHQRKGDA